MQYAPIPQEMYAPSGQPGTLQRFWYDSRGKRKDALVFCPMGMRAAAGPIRCCT